MFNPLSTAALAIATTATQHSAAAILVVGDATAEASAIGGILQAGQYHVVLVQSADSANIELNAREFSVIVCALANTSSQSLQSVAAMRSHKLNATTPMILLMPLGADHASVMRVLGSGIVDCVAQPIDEFVLRTKVKMFVDMYRNKQRLREVETQGGGLLTDALTGLPNRVLFMDRADQAMRQAARSGGRVAIASMDVEAIQEVRETLGPVTADELLRQIALHLTSTLRRSDTVARVADTTFGTVLACDTRDGVETVTTRLERVMSDPFLVGGHRIILGGGIGVALFPDHGREPKLLIDRAHAAMVHARQNSMGHLFYDPIKHAEADDNSYSAEMNADELIKVSAA